MADTVNITCRFKFDKLGGKYSLDSLRRNMSASSSVGGAPNYAQLRQNIGTSEELLEAMFDVEPIDFLYIVNRDSTGIVTYGRYLETHMFKLKPTELAFIRPVQISTFGIKSDTPNTIIDFFILERLDI